MEILNKFNFWHITLVLAILASIITYIQGSNGFSQESATIYIFIWTLVASWISLQFYKGGLKKQNEELKNNIEDWKATVVDYREEYREKTKNLEQENEELRQTIKEILKEKETEEKETE